MPLPPLEENVPAYGAIGLGAFAYLYKLLFKFRRDVRGDGAEARAAEVSENTEKRLQGEITRLEEIISNQGKKIDQMQVRLETEIAQKHAAEKRELLHVARISTLEAELSGVELVLERVTGKRRERKMRASPDLLRYLGGGDGWECGPGGGPALTAYFDKVGNVWTIGFGHTEGVCEGDILPDEQAAYDLLDHDLAPRADDLSRALTRTPTQYQFDAMLSILFNVGRGTSTRDGILRLAGPVPRPSTLIRKFNAGDVEGASAEFVKWDKSGGAEVNGLLRRREGDQAIFDSADYSGRP